MKLTPFEQAQRNSVIHGKRMEMTLKVTELVEQLKEAQLFLDVMEAKQAEDQEYDCLGMYDPELIETVKREVMTITATLTIMASTWEAVAGVSA
tara:strand:+ start:231 stop:512 length:282 start_codon:yes stop_codon:yes gene_type:complete